MLEFQKLSGTLRDSSDLINPRPIQITGFSKTRPRTLVQPPKDGVSAHTLERQWGRGRFLDDFEALFSRFFSLPWQGWDWRLRPIENIQAGVGSSVQKKVDGVLYPPVDDSLENGDVALLIVESRVWIEGWQDVWISTCQKWKEKETSP